MNIGFLTSRQSIKKLEVRDVELIVKGILLSLPCHGTNRSRGDDILEVLIDRARAPLLMRTSDFPSLEITCSFLALAQLVCAERHAASPAKLLRFYLSNLTGRMVLQKFSPGSRVDVISWIADTLAACEAEMPNPRYGWSEEQLQRLQKQVVDASSILLEVCYHQRKQTLTEHDHRRYLTQKFTTLLRGELSGLYFRQSVR